MVFGGFSAEALRDRILDADARVITADGGFRRGKPYGLNQNPKRYTQYGVPSGKGNMWYGTTVTNSEDMERIYQLPTLLNTFASIEPLLEDIDENISALKYLNWIIIGAETGHRKRK